MSETEPSLPPAGRSGHIRSFVRRQGKITAGQRLAREQLLSQWSLPYQATRLNLEAVFGRAAPVTLEIGFGMGETTAQMAQAMPERNFLGLEVYPAGVGSLLRRIESEGIANIRIIEHDAVEVLEHCIGDGCLESVHIYFPDPWPKARHAKRRFVHPAMLPLVWRVLKPGAFWRIASDDPTYQDWVRESFAGQEFFTLPEPATVRPEGWPPTRYEQKALREGRQPLYWQAVRRG